MIGSDLSFQALKGRNQIAWGNALCKNEMHASPERAKQYSIGQRPMFKKEYKVSPEGAKDILNKHW